MNISSRMDNIRTLVFSIEDVVDDNSKKDIARVVRRELDCILGELGGSTSSRVIEVSGTEIAMVSRGNKLEAVKSYKERTGLSLLDSKRAVEKAAGY